jgi:hypothetical protein
LKGRRSIRSGPRFPLPMSHSQNPSNPPNLDPLLHQISQAHGTPDDDSFTEAAIISSVAYLQQLPQEIHWLCNSSPLFPVVVQAIQLWGYGETPAQTTLAKFKPTLAKALSRCPDCAVVWHSEFRRELKRVFTEVYSYHEDSTVEFYIALDEWDSDRVYSALDNALQIIERIPMPWKHIGVKAPLVEGLAEPTLLLKDKLFRLWKEVYLKLEKMPSGVGDKWMPGAMVLLFDLDPRIRDFGEKMFKKRDQKIGNVEFDLYLRKALEALVVANSQKVLSFDTIHNIRLTNEISKRLRFSGTLSTPLYGLARDPWSKGLLHPRLSVFSAFYFINSLLLALISLQCLAFFLYSSKSFRRESGNARHARH